MIMDSDHDSCLKKGQFRNLFDLKYREETNAADFYREYRNLLISSLKKEGNIIKWQNNRVLDEDEQLSPTFEELILANVLGLIDIRLPGHAMDHYGCNSMGNSDSLMDFKTDIFGRVPTFIKEIQNNISVSSSKQEDQLER